VTCREQWREKSPSTGLGEFGDAVPGTRGFSAHEEASYSGAGALGVDEMLMKEKLARVCGSDQRSLVELPGIEAGSKIRLT
jgi:hypothetical protein